MEERNENHKSNGEWQEGKQQPKWQGLEQKEKKKGCEDSRGR